ncbi:hypothetical protein BDR06DRAFT_874321, partial [Suillus hirtellus]
SELKKNEDTWAEAFTQENFNADLCKVIHNMNVENECKDVQDAHAAAVMVDHCRNNNTVRHE